MHKGTALRCAKFQHRAYRPEPLLTTKHTRFVCPIQEPLMECTINWGGPQGMLFVAETGSGHIATMDGAPDGGGNNLAPRPMEMMLAGAGGCAAYDVVLILKRGRHKIEGCQVKLTSQRADTDPKVFTHIDFAFTVSGRGLPAAAVERAVKLSHDKYCSASAMLAKTAEITYSVSISDIS